MPIATDGNGNYLTLDPGTQKWMPAPRARNDAGDELVLDGGEWKPLTKGGGGEYGFKPAPPEPPKQTPPPQEQFDPLSGAHLGGDIPPVSPDQSGIGRIATAAVQGFQNGGFLTPEAQAAADASNNQTWMGRNVVAPLVAASNVPFRAMGALGGAVGQAAYEAGNAVGGPAAGRDAYMVNQLMSVLPAVSGHPLPPNQMVPSLQPTPRFVQEYYGEGTPQNPLAAAPALERPSFVPPGVNVAAQPVKIEPPAFVPPELRSSAPVAGSVGAAASREGTSQQYLDMTPKQVQAYRSTAEGQKLLETQQPGVQDATPYVRGVNPTTAEIEQTVNTAREQKALGMASQDVSQEARNIAADNNTARKAHFDQLAGSDVNLMNAEAARAEQAQRDLATTWANKTAANPQPVLDTAAAIKASPDGMRPLVRRLVDSVANELTDAKGNVITDPELLYGVRKHVDDLINEQDLAGKPVNERAMANLLQMKQTLDGVIEAAAPGFGQYLKNFSEASKPIDTMRILQKHENGLYDAQGVMQHSRVQTMMRKIVDARQGPGMNPYKSIPDETVQQLFSLRDDLRRSASARDLANAPGSDTAQNMLGMLKSAASGTGGTVGATVAGHVLAGPIGGAALGFGKNIIDNLLSARTAKRQTQRGMQMLHPEVPPNRLLRD